MEERHYNRGGIIMGGGGTAMGVGGNRVRGGGGDGPPPCDSWTDGWMGSFQPGSSLLIFL